MQYVTKKATSTGVIELLDMPNGGASDITLKKDIKELDSALQDILSLRPVTWYWKSDLQNEELQHGFIAQEVESILPSLVSEEERSDGTRYKSLSSKALLPYLVKALEEQQEQISALMLQVEALEGQKK